MNLKLKVVEKGAYYTNFDNFCLAKNFLKSQIQYNNESKQKKIIKNIISENLNMGYQFILKNYDTFSQYSGFFNKYK